MVQLLLMTILNDEILFLNMTRLLIDWPLVLIHLRAMRRLYEITHDLLSQPYSLPKVILEQSTYI
jgi:hypothetical protein